jgi:glycosyltransferase involved in cell wall biosynthesis
MEMRQNMKAPNDNKQLRVAAVIPSYKVTKHVLGVINNIGSDVDLIIVVDDCCPELSGKYVEDFCRDPRVKVIYHEENQGVGGATITGYRYALQQKIDIVVKIDGDGQMDPGLIPSLIEPLRNGVADYTKGNRFYELELLRQMPAIRLIGNAVLSFVSKAASGYWSIMDPTNGFTAIHRTALSLLPLAKIERRYFFESDILFRLNTIRAVVLDMPMAARYEDEESNMKIGNILRTFPAKYSIRALKRILYTHFLRGFTVGTVQLLPGLLLFGFGVTFGSAVWYHYGSAGIETPTGTIALVALPLVFGFQLLIGAWHFDVQDEPRNPLQKNFLFKPYQRESEVGSEMEFDDLVNG